MHARLEPPARRWRAACAAALAFAALLHAARAEAQVNAEPLRGSPLRPDWSAGADLAFSLLQGNVNVLDIGGGARVQYQTLHRDAGGKWDALPFIHHRFFMMGGGRFSRQLERTVVSQALAHIRWTAMWHRRFGSDLFVQYQYNQFQRLRARAVGGGGARVEIVHSRPLLLALGGGYMFEYNHIAVARGAADSPNSFEHRMNSFLSARLSLWGDRLVAQNTLYFQPRFDDFGDFRLLDELEVTSKVSDWLSLGTTFGVLHDSRPPTSVVPTDLRLAATVKVGF